MASLPKIKYDFQADDGMGPQERRVREEMKKQRDGPLYADYAGTGVMKEHEWYPLEPIISKKGTKRRRLDRLPDPLDSLRNSNPTSGGRRTRRRSSVKRKRIDKRKSKRRRHKK